MRFRGNGVGLVAVLLAVISVGSTAAPSARDDISVVMPASKLHFYQNKEGMTVANAWGDPATGPHSNYIRMPGRTASGLHTHSFSYYGVVISGTVANEPTAAASARALGPGSYWYQKGGEPHVTRCVSSQECLFFVTSKGPFDYLPVN